MSSVLDSVTFTGSFQITNAPSGSYYLVLKHRNSIETWSSSPVNYVAGSTISYNFTTSAANAFGNNMIQVDPSPVRFAIYSGDVNQDNIIDAGDLSQVENDIDFSGYISSDVNGDNYVDAADVSIVENNIDLGILVVTP